MKTRIVQNQITKQFKVQIGDFVCLHPLAGSGKKLVWGDSSKNRYNTKDEAQTEVDDLTGEWKVV